jgi:hypothetical protein
VIVIPVVGEQRFPPQLPVLHPVPVTVKTWKAGIAEIMGVIARIREDMRMGCSLVKLVL